MKGIGKDHIEPEEMLEESFCMTWNFNRLQFQFSFYHTLSVDYISLSLNLFICIVDVIVALPHGCDYRIGPVDFYIKSIS